MPCKFILVFVLTLFGAAGTWALEPNEVLVVANANISQSVQLARYYCQVREVPSGYVVPLALGSRLADGISRADYEKRIAQPLRRIFATREDLSHIKCLVTTYGVPFKVGPRGELARSDARLTRLRDSLEQEKQALAELEQAEKADSTEFATHTRKKQLLELDIDRVTGRETHASVDSELSLVLYGAYELYRWQPNLLRRSESPLQRTFMVSRLDGPSYEIAQGLVDKALAAEAEGLHGTAYVDSRGIYKKDAYGQYDQAIRDLALLIQLRSTLPVKEERTGALFEPNACPETALYCGWYSVKKYVDAFDFVPGAVGFHIASYEAVNLRDSASTQWCPAMLRDGITATLGAVAEPYLHSFPDPRAFFSELFEGRCLVEAYYRSKPFNSWQLQLIGDPLYTPFPRK
jgi:uncharacterized protein (TIGR03790 family)